MDETKFKRYEAVRNEGAYNMVLDAEEVMSKAGLSSEEYWYIVCNYRDLKKKFG